jgi:tetratricopeptide (TPR) repeat protein/tRNA A-37 threonylcarbamoyl transferase component Bud32
MDDSQVLGTLQLSGYELQRRLGAGGMAEVFLAKKRGAEGTYKQLVVKRILPEHARERRFRHMFIAEAQLATRLNHPNIVQIYEFSDHGDELLLSMEYVEGVDLGKLLRTARKRQTKLPVWVSAYVAAEVAKGLHYAHERKDEGGLPLAIVHRDVSPQNVLISFGGVVKIADFGIATANLFREEGGVLKGKVAYMSPEQARGEKVDRRSDVYALGIVAHEMLTGQPAYGALRDDALLEAVRQASVRPPRHLDPDLPPELDAVVVRALARRPEDRYQTARELATEIARTLIERRELVDHTTVEEVLAGLLDREPAAHGVGEAAEDPQQRTLAAVRKARTDASSGTGPQYSARRVVREVRHVAVVTMRLEGVEALCELSGEPAARRVMAATRATLDDIAYKHGAVWSWEGESAANAVVGLMQNPARAPNDASMLAVDVHEFLSGHSEDLPVQMRASIGIVRGIAAGERDDQGHLVDHELYAPAPYLAAELGRRTPFGKTWVAGGVYRLVKRELRWSDGPTIELADAASHNVPERMRAYVLLRPVTAEERLAELELNPTDLVGRDAEKADLHAAFHRTVYHPGLSTPPPPSSSGTVPRTMPANLKGELLARVVVGEVGIGKSALVEAFLGELPELVRVYRVECSPVKMELPYATTCELLRSVAGLADDEPFEAAVAALRRILRPGATEPGDTPPPSGQDPATASRRGSRPPAAHGRIERVIARLAEVVTERPLDLGEEDAASHHHDLVVLGVRLLFGAIAREAPVVIVVDGLQWADRNSLEVLAQVLERREALPVLTLLVTRPDDRVLPYIEGLVRNELGGLSAEEQVRLVQTRLGVRDGAADVCRELVPKVGGNPYFLLELIDALLERGALEIVERAEGDATLVRHEERSGDLAAALPSTIEQLVGDRLGELPSAEHDVVDWLAVAAGPLAETDLMALTRLADDEAITRLCARGLCDKRGRVVDFRHPLARDVAYNALDPVQRARMHRRLGEHYAATPLGKGLSAAIVGQHLERGEAPRQAAEMYLEAARAARNAHQTPLAVRYFQRALALLPAGDRRILGAHEALEKIYRYLGRSQDRRTHLAALRRLARESRDAQWVAVALTRSAQLDQDEGAQAHGLPAAQRAADAARHARQPDLEVEALIVLTELLRDLGDVNGALAACERALEVASSRRVSARARAEVLRAKGVLLRRAGRLHAAIQAQSEAIAIFRAVGARRSEARSRNALGFALFVAGRYEDAIAMCLASIRLDLMVGGRFQVAKTLSNIGNSYARLGRADHGLTYLARARQAHERFEDHDGHVDTLLVTASVLVERGEAQRARQLVDEARAFTAVGGSVYDRIHALVVRALVERALGDPAAAVAHASEGRQLAEAQALPSYHVYATAIEAAARVDMGERQAGALLATNAFEAVEAMEGSEYGIEVRSLCCDALHRALAADASGRASDRRAELCRRSLAEVERVAGYVRDPASRQRFFERPQVRVVVEHAGQLDGRDSATP